MLRRWVAWIRLDGRHLKLQRKGWGRFGWEGQALLNHFEVDLKFEVFLVRWVGQFVWKKCDLCAKVVAPSCHAVHSFWNRTPCSNPVSRRA